MRCSKTCASWALAVAAIALAACGTVPSDQEVKQATEERAPPPAAPQAERLVPVDLGGSFQYFIDPASISVAAQKVVRYTLVARSPSGAANVTYEALLCDRRQHRLYAVGQEDGGWKPARESEWSAVGEGVGSYYANLADFYFCPNGKAVGDASEALRAIQLGRHPATADKNW